MKYKTEWKPQSFAVHWSTLLNLVREVRFANDSVSVAQIAGESYEHTLGKWVSCFGCRVGIVIFAGIIRGRCAMRWRLQWRRYPIDARFCAGCSMCIMASLHRRRNAKWCGLCRLVEEAELMLFRSWIVFLWLVNNCMMSPLRFWSSIIAMTCHELFDNE